MSNKAIDANMYCPFYVAEAPMSITCEGVIGELTVNRFGSISDKVYHEENFCTKSTCRGCGVYSALLHNYIPPEKKRSAVIRH